MSLSGSCPQRTGRSFLRSPERGESLVPDSCEMCTHQGRRPPVKSSHHLWALRSVSRPPGSRVPARSPAEPPSSPPSHSPLNLLSWYQVSAPLLDSTQTLPVLQRPAPSSSLSPQRLLVMLKEIFTVTHITHSLCSPPVTLLLCFSRSRSRLLRLRSPRIHTRSLV